MVLCVAAMLRPWCNFRFNCNGTGIYCSRNFIGSSSLCWGLFFYKPSCVSQVAEDPARTMLIPHCTDYICAGIVKTTERWAKSRCIAAQCYLAHLGFTHT